jgi:hypothetical protein
MRSSPIDEFRGMLYFYLSSDIINEKVFFAGYRYINKAADIIKNKEAKPCIKKIRK